MSQFDRIQNNASTENVGIHRSNYQTAGISISVGKRHWHRALEPALKARKLLSWSNAAEESKYRHADTHGQFHSQDGTEMLQAPRR